MNVLESFEKHNLRKENQERLLYNCRNTMKMDPAWNIMNTNGKCDDYTLLINNTKEIKKQASRRAEQFYLNCNLWRPCFETLQKILKMYGFKIDERSLNSNPDNCLISK